MIDLNTRDRIIVPKNSRLGTECRKVVTNWGYDDGQIESDYRGEDIPELVEDLIRKGESVLGITGADFLEEYKLRNPESNLSVLRNVYWDRNEFLYREPMLCLLGPKNGNLDLIPEQIRIAINRKYQNISERYCLKELEEKGYRFERKYMAGATEKRFEKGLSDLIIEIVCSGRSSEESGLVPYLDIFSCNIVLIGSDTKTNKSERELNVNEGEV